MTDDSAQAWKTYAERLDEMLRGYFVAQALYVAVRLSLPDLLAVQERSSDDLAAETGTNPDALYRLMRALAGEGIFIEHPAHLFSLSPMGALLRCDSPSGMRDTALIAGEAQYKVWAVFRDAVRSGTPGFDRIFRSPLFEFLNDHPDIHTMFDGSMCRISRWALETLLAFGTFHPGETVVDVGGGMGSLLAGLLEQHAQLKGVLLDLPPVIDRARGSLAGRPILSRLEFISGDFHRKVPPGEVMILSSILHMLNDDLAVSVLRNCAASLRASGRVIIVEQVLAEPNVPEPGKWGDLNMLMMTGGRERTFAEYATLLERAGFKMPELLGTSTGFGGYRLVTASIH